MKMNWMVMASLLSAVSGTAMAASQPSDTFVRINADCSTVRECVCQEVCNDTCRIVNGQQVCDESCKTICEYATSEARE
jgi:hypothetical protein